MSGKNRKVPLRRREFMDEVKRVCEAALNVDTGEMRTRSTMNLLKVHFNPNFRIHYELMISAEKGIIEVGLHFEDGPESTARLLEHFDRHVLEIKHQLGPNFEIERWTRSWGHVFETHEIEALTEGFARRLGLRMVEIIEVLQPLLDDATGIGLVSETPRPGSGRRRFRR
ncbi:hypothetical protein BH23CHL2_BH23CHL2_28230 [soil metagenome]